MATPNERLHRVNTLPTSGYEVGGVYFVRSEGKIYIRTESGWECFDKASEATSADTASKVGHSLSVNGQVYYDGSKDVTFTKTTLGLSNVENTADQNKKIRESNLQWDSQCLTGTVSPVDAAMIPTMGSNRFGFFDPSHIKVEYSTDAGATWIDYGATDDQKLRLVTQDLDYSDLRVGKATSASDRSVDGRLKITFFDFKTAKYNGVQTALYGPLRKFALDVSTDGASDCWCTIRKNTAANPDVFTDVVTKTALTGWSGWNTININDNRITMYNNDANNQASKIEFIFGQDSFSSSSYAGLAILKLYAFDPTLYAGNQYAKTGNVHSIDSRMNVTFPSYVIAKLDANSSRINNVATPTLSTDAANKAYVDSKVSGGGSVTTDTSMSATSTNPVQNKVIKSYVDSLVGTAITQLAQI